MTVDGALFDATVRRHLRFLAPGRPLDPAERLSALGLDSMAAINLLFDLEEAFGVTVPDALLVPATFETAESLRAVLAELLGAGTP